MISATAEHALRAVLCFAQHPEHTTLASDTVAATLGAPRNYLAKTLNALAKAGVLRSSRGPGGGFALAIPPDELTIERVIAPFSDLRKHDVCLLRSQPCNGADPCAAHAHWNSIRSQQRTAISSTTIADLLGSQVGVLVTA